MDVFGSLLEICYHRYMDVLSFNAQWMLWNAILAVLPVAFAYLYFKADHGFYKIVLAVLWLLFFPNALYIVSDMEHVIWQWPLASFGERLLLLVQYLHLEVIGLLAYICGMYAFEKELRHRFKKRHRKFVSTSIIALNFIIGFAIVMGKVERVNSWDVFSATDTVISAAFNVLSSDELTIVSIMFGLFGNFFYFLFRDPVIRFIRSFMRAERLTNTSRGI